MRVNVRLVTKADAEAWVAMRAALWPGADPGELRLDVARHFAAHAEPLMPHRVVIAERQGRPAGMLELSLRPYADGCRSSPVPFIEGWYVVPEARRRGIGGALVAAAEAWARRHGHTEMASDALLENAIGERAHRALGFEEVERAIHFRKPLSG